MNKVKIKPLSVNQAWKGRRFKTNKYKKYERDVLLLLPNGSIPEGRLDLFLEVGLSSVLADLDNIAKPFIDILQKRYNFNDSMIYKLNMVKVIVSKGNEYIKFEITKYEVEVKL